jgi:two-component system cell cycle sensor histidine kinase/response regulator CckA
VIARVRRLFARAQPRPRLIDCFVGPLDAPIRLLFEEPSAGRAVADRQGRLVRANAILRRMIGAGDLPPGMALRDLFAEADRNAVAAELADPAGQPMPTVRLLRDADPPLAVGVTISPLHGAGGVIEGLLMSAVEAAELSQPAAHGERLQATGQLAGGIAHDFNNLLTAIVGGADAIAQHAGLDDSMLEEIAAIRASADRGAALVRHLLASGRQQIFQPRVLALDSVVANLGPVLRRMLGRVRLDLALERPEALVRVDPTALERVLVNLAVNARDAMAGGGILTVRTGHLTLHRPLARGPETIPAGSYAMVEVQDTGNGIPAAVLPHIFEPFFTTRRGEGGTGLGLATVHGIVRQCEGFLAVESATGQGTRMRVYLPAWHGPPESAAPAQPRLPWPEPAAARGILLVDDEDVVRRVAERALLRQGFRVLSAPTGEAALALLDSEPSPRVAAIVTDLVLPGMDGTALVAAVRQRLGSPRLPALLVSGYAAGMLRDKLAASSAGGETRYLAKPYDLKELAAALAEITA